MVGKSSNIVNINNEQVLPSSGSASQVEAVLVSPLTDTLLIYVHGWLVGLSLYVNIYYEREIAQSEVFGLDIY